jgi:hypothetical protein
MTLNEKDPRRPKRIKKKAEDLANFCDERHKHHASKAQVISDNYSYRSATIKITGSV